MNSSASDVQKLPDVWVLPARVAWLVLTVTLLFFVFGGIPLFYEQLTQTCSEASCLVLLLHPVEAEILNEAGLTLQHYAIFHFLVETLMVLLWLGLAILIFWKQFRTTIGLILAFLLVFFGLFVFSETSVFFIEAYVPWGGFLTTVQGLPLILFIYLFPNGRFVPDWTKSILLLFFILTLISLPFQEDFENIVNVFGTLTFIVTALLGLFSQIYRYRFVSNSVQKRQTRLALFGLAALLFGIFNYITFFEMFRPEPGQTRLFLYTFQNAFNYVLFLFFPISLVIAIMRHRLFDIDVLIRRTLIYGLLSATLLAIYLTSVISIQTAFRSLTGQDSTLVVVLSTLAIAALFTPLRRGIQNLIDRRFYRRKYNAEKVLAEFAEKARDEIELEALTRELTEVVKETMQPSHISLWIKNKHAKGAP